MLLDKLPSEMIHVECVMDCLSPNIPRWYDFRMFDPNGGLQFHSLDSYHLEDCRNLAIIPGISRESPSSLTVYGACCDPGPSLYRLQPNAAALNLLMPLRPLSRLMFTHFDQQQSLWST